VTARRGLIMMVAVVVLALAVAAGIRQARDNGLAPGADRSPLSRVQVTQVVSATPRDLAAVRRRVNVLRPGGAAAFAAELRALQGRPVVVNFWASWCPPCRAELPLFQRQAVKHARTVAFLGVNVADDLARARKLLARYPLPYPSVIDARHAIATGRFRARFLPITVFYSPRGRHVVHQGPFSTETQLSEAIARYASG
jgi:thiol-disulfide isomerase/thioredoxin